MNLSTWLSIAKQPTTTVYCDARLPDGRRCDYPLRYTGLPFEDEGAFVCDACEVAGSGARSVGASPQEMLFREGATGNPLPEAAPRTRSGARRPVGVGR